jgi:histone deacetylase 6
MGQTPPISQRSVPQPDDVDSDDEFFAQQPRTAVDELLTTAYDSQLRQLVVTPQSASSEAPPPADPATALLGLVYDTRMTRHRGQPSHPERPDRIRAIAKRLVDQDLLKHCIRIPCRPVTEAEKLLAHDVKLNEQIAALAAQVGSDPETVGFIDGDTYVCCDSVMAAELAAGSLIDATSAAIQGLVKHAFAIIRPPGHHAEHSTAMGFCLWDNVAIAAQYAINRFGLQRVAVIDWDIHHGNGIQEIFETRRDLLYISLHRHPFYPGTGSHDKIGSGDGAGFSANIPWPRAGFGDADYLKAFEAVIQPLLTEYQPQLILIASGFDAAKGDPLGGTHLTPHGYYAMTLRLLSCGVPVVTALEGGYNLSAISRSAEAVVRALVGLPCPFDPSTDKEQADIDDIIRQVSVALSPFWECFAAHRPATPPPPPPADADVDADVDADGSAAPPSTASA